MQERAFQIKARIIWFFLRIQIAWLRFRLLKLSPQEYIYTHPPIFISMSLASEWSQFHEGGRLNSSLMASLYQNVG